MSMWMRAALAALVLTVGVTATAAPPVLVRDGEAMRLAAAAETSARRLGGGASGPEQLAKAEGQLGQIERLAALGDDRRIAVGPAAAQRLVRAAERLQAAIDSARAASAPAGKATTALGTVTGTVTDASTGTPLQGISVQARNFTTQAVPTGAGVVATGVTNASGVYTLTLPAGPYHVRTTNAGTVAALAPGYRNRAFGFAPDCDDTLYCPRYVGTVVTAADNTAVSNINFALNRAGAITGTLRKASDASVLAGVGVNAVGENGFIFLGAATNASGVFTLNGAPPGRYRVYAGLDPVNVPAQAGLESALYRASGGSLPCGLSTDCTFAPGDLVTVTANTTTGGIDISAPSQTVVSGTITEDPSGTPIAGALVYLISEDGYTYGQSDPAPGDPNGASTDAAGNYVFSQVRPGNYRLYVSATGFLSEAYPNTRCADPQACHILSTGGVISVPGGSTVSGRNLALSRGASISGTITRASNGTPVVGATVGAGNAAFSEVARATTDASGNFTLSGMPDGVMHVYAYLNGVSDVTDTAYGNSICPAAEIGYCLSAGPGITASAATPVTGINIAMAPGGTISGVITDGTSGVPAPTNRTRVEIFAVPAPGAPQPTSYTFIELQANGAYSASGLAPGAYRVIFSSNSSVGWVDTSFGGQPCPRGGCDQSVLPTVFVTAGATTSGVNQTVNRGHLISGNVSDVATGQPIALTRQFDATGLSSKSVGFYTDINNYAGFGQLDSAGRYMSRTGFPDGPIFGGTFLLRNLQPLGFGYVDTLYNNHDCPWFSCGVTSGNALTVAGADLVGVNFALRQGGVIAGTVRRGSDSAPLETVLVEAWNAAGKKVGESRSDPNGGYFIYGLPTGTYYLTTSNQLGYLDEAYNNVPCEPFCNPVNSNPVTVTEPATTSGRDFTLDQAATISGTVTDGAAAANVPVEIYGAVGNFIRSTTSNAAGAYQFADLAAGRYYVRTRNATGRADALYSANPCVGNACVIRSGTPIDVAAGATASGINLALASPATISGTVTNLAGGAGLSGISLQLLDSRGAVAMTTTSSASGAFSFASLAAGSYYVVTRNTPGFIDVSFNNVPCPAACNGLNGTPITVTAGGSATANIPLSTGASISGTVRSGPSTPVPGAVVQVYNGSGTPVGQIATNASGNYQINALADGPYYVRSQNALGFIDEVYNDHACSGYCDLLSGNAVNVSGAVSVGLIDFLLAPGGAISGTVTAASGGAGIPVATVQAYDVNGLPAGSATTNAAGVYTIRGLANGSYKVRTLNTAGYINQVYNGQSCSPTPCPLSGGAAVAVAGSTVNGINFSLAAGGTIAGTATDLFNNPLPTGAATLYNASGVDIATVAISNGHWEFNGLGNGTYYVLIENNVGLVDQLYANQPCPAGACNITTVGTPIVLSGAGARANLGNIVTGTAAIDLRLPTGQTISGNVKDAGTNAPLANATVYLFNGSGAGVGEGTTDALGNFTSTGGLPPGTYYAATANGVSRGVGNGYVNALYSGSNCLLGCTVTSGTPIVVSSAPVTGINFSLAKGGSFGGFVKDNLGNPLALVTVQLVDAAGKAAGSFSTNSLGRYSADGLPAGTYYARTVNVLGLQDVLYGDAPCSGNCNVLGSSPITITASPGNADANFTLSPQVLLFKDGFE